MSEISHKKLSAEIDKALSPDGHPLSERETKAKKFILARIEPGNPKGWTRTRARILINNRPALLEFVASFSVAADKKEQETQKASDVLRTEITRSYVFHARKTVSSHLRRIKNSLSDFGRHVSEETLLEALKNAPPLQAYLAIELAKENAPLRKFRNVTREIVLSVGTGLLTYALTRAYDVQHMKPKESQSIPQIIPFDNKPLGLSCPKGDALSGFRKGDKAYLMCEDGGNVYVEPLQKQAAPQTLTAIPENDAIQTRNTSRGPRGPNDETVCSLLEDGKTVILPDVNAIRINCRRPGMQILLKPNFIKPSK